MALSLQDILAMPNDPDPEHLRRLGLLPPAPTAAPVPVIPQVAGSSGVTVPKMSAVTPKPEPTPVAAPELGPISMPSPENVVKPMTPPRPTEKESVAAGIAEHGGTEKEEGQRQYQELRPEITAPAGSADYYQQSLAQQEFERTHPWGGEISTHPGLLGKIGHVAAKIGNVAGDIVAPGTMANIPGTDLNKQEKESATEGQLERAQAGERATAKEKSEAELRAAEVGKASREPVAFGKTPSELTMHDLMTGGENGDPRINPDTGKPYTYLEAYTAEQKASAESKALPEGERPLGDKVAQLNAGLTSRYHVLNPGKPLPAEFTLPTNATQKDYDRIDKALESTEKATGTKAQLDLINEQRNQSARDREESQKDKEEKEGHKLVIGTNPKTNEEEMLSAAEAKKRGLTNTYEAPADTTNKALAARHFLPLVDNKDPANPGILQMIDVLDKRGELGTIASRWDEFLTGKLGAGDPDYERLRVAMGLGQTLLMNLHVGSRGGAYMMEHFADLANAGKMNAQILRAGVQQEEKYAKQRAMMPAAQEGENKGKVASQDDVNAYAKVHNISSDEAKKKFTSAGYTVK